ncbi:OmpP1/FadL family transporter [Marinomonas transparens]|uniref:Outer membrane protein transport protein n=1 Tax=Marinomonas transparens TaxID=2795388 RepID=A0A934JKP0_9GAMM|nr:outer membrane protein transport protein [Marinomonas transparens]MBJ7537586.1 outer membrane protein transport protein [Marinomonas transparens]
MTIFSKPNRVLFKASVVAVSVAAASSAFSSGFALNDHSATASGTALAGAAASNADISFSFWNPALFANADKTTLYASGAYVVPSMDVTINSAKDAQGRDLAASSPTTSSDSVDNALIPSFYFAKPISDKTVAGISLNVPFGLSGDYGDKWAGRFHATETALQDIALSFALAHRVNDMVSVGASVQFHQADVTLGSQVGVALASSTEGNGDIEADATGYGYSFGVALEPRKGTRLGLGYRSEVDFDFKGDVKYTNVTALNGAPFNSGLDDTTITDSITLPSVLTLSAEQELSPKMVLGLSAIRTGWSSMDGLNIDFDSSQANSVLSFDFEDQWMYSAGLTYEYSDKLTLRTGVAMDNSPVTDKDRSARTPDGDRKWISFGGTYDLNDMTSATFAYTHVTIEDVTVNRDGTKAEDGARGTLNADYKSSADVISLAVNMVF